MTNAMNNIQQYIVAYSTKLSNATNNKVTADVGRYRGDFALEEFDYIKNSENKNLLNPSGIGYFWIGSSSSYGADFVHGVFDDGDYSIIDQTYFDGRSFDKIGDVGVRPVIFISLM